MTVDTTADAANREHWRSIFDHIAYIDNAEDRTNYLLLEHGRLENRVTDGQRELARLKDAHAAHLTSIATAVHDLDRRIAQGIQDRDDRAAVNDCLRCVEQAIGVEHSKRVRILQDEHVAVFPNSHAVNNALTALRDGREAQRLSSLLRAGDKALEEAGIDNDGSDIAVRVARLAEERNDANRDALSAHAQRDLAETAEQRLGHELAEAKGHRDMARSELADLETALVLGKWIQASEFDGRPLAERIVSALTNERAFGDKAVRQVKDLEGANRILSDRAQELTRERDALAGRLALQWEPAKAMPDDSLDPITADRLWELLGMHDPIESVTPAQGRWLVNIAAAQLVPPQKTTDDASKLAEANAEIERLMADREQLRTEAAHLKGALSDALQHAEAGKADGYPLAYGRLSPAVKMAIGDTLAPAQKTAGDAETLTRAEAEARLLALGHRPHMVEDFLDEPRKHLANNSYLRPGTYDVLLAYVRYLDKPVADAAKPARPKVGRWVKLSEMPEWSVVDDRGDSVAEVWSDVDGTHWWAARPFQARDGGLMAGDGVDVEQAAKAAALSVLRTWADVVEVAK